jgi:hypothetical protein
MKLGAVGLNFAMATREIINDMDWNPSTNLQSEYRIHRIDSEKPVFIDYMYFKGTYDEEMYRRVMKKQSVNDGMSTIIQKANTTNDPAERQSLADKFLMHLIDTLILGLKLMPKDVAEIERLKNLAFPAQVAAKAANWYNRNKVSL